MNPILLTLALGVSSSLNLGEHPGLLIRASAGTSTLATVTTLDLSAKYTGAGYRFSQQADVRLWKNLYGGGEYVMRSGGAWVKQSVRLRMVVALYQDLQVAVSRDIWQDTSPVVAEVSVRYTKEAGRLTLGGESGYVRYLDSHGFYSMLWAGIGHTSRSR